MSSDLRIQYVTRDRILKLLSDDEVARVSTAETAAHLSDGEEYLDLEHLDQGVQRATSSTSTPMGRVLPRNAVQEDTWSKIVEQSRAALVSAETIAGRAYEKFLARGRADGHDRQDWIAAERELLAEFPRH